MRRDQNSRCPAQPKTNSSDCLGICSLLSFGLFFSIATGFAPRILEFSDVCKASACEGESPQLTDPAKALKINVVGYRNGVGLSRDLDILITALQELGHTAQFVNINAITDIPKADINVFVELVHEHFFASASK